MATNKIYAPNYNGTSKVGAYVGDITQFYNGTQMRGVCTAQNLTIVLSQPDLYFPQLIGYSANIMAWVFKTTFYFCLVYFNFCIFKIRLEFR